MAIYYRELEAWEQYLKAQSFSDDITNGFELTFPFFITNAIDYK